jgi:threonyl-tRNA synthetase
MENQGQLTVKLLDGSTRDVPTGSTAEDLAKAIGSKLAKKAVVAEVNGIQVDLTRELQDGDVVRIITEDTDEGRFVIRHSTAHVMAQAVIDLYPGTNIAIGPPIENGFYYDMMLSGDATLTPADLERVEAKMREIIAADQKFERRTITTDEALAMFRGNPYKTEIIENVETAQGVEDGFVSVYANPPGNFCDLCRGPHVLSTKRLGHFKLQSVAGAYWRGDEHRDMLQRIYGTAWESDAKLKDYLHMLEEAERRDHRKLGQELDLFSFPEEIGSGLPVFHPKGGLMRKLMEDYSRKRHEAAGYSFVNTPHITKADLFEVSGHLGWFKENMYPPMELEGTDYYVKPMNCPMHILIYRSRQRSYRELPLRLFEFGTVYRYEKSGVIHGLTRVRGLTMDDSHIFVDRDGMRAEIKSVLEFILQLLSDYGLNDFYLELSTRPEGKAAGTDEEWETATATLREVAESSGLELVMDEGGGAFYGPKISVQARDAIGRSWQMSTVQLDFQLPMRFGLEYTAPDNSRQRPVMIHRALFGSVERFMGVLIEHYAGAFPAWLAPEQVRVLAVRDDNEEYAQSVVARLSDAGFRVGIDPANEPLGARIRKAKLEKLPYVLVVGDDDVANGTVGVNPRGGEVQRGVSVDDFSAQLAEEARI